MLMIRLARIGKKKRPFYRIVVTEKTRPAQRPLCRNCWHLRSAQESAAIDDEGPSA